MYSWLPIAGCVIALTRPHEGSYDAWNAARLPHSYWLSPRSRTPAKPPLTSRSDVAFSRHEPDVPSPLLKPEFAGSQAMSPAAAITGSTTAAPAVVRTVAPAVMGERRAAPSSRSTTCARGPRSRCFRRSVCRSYIRALLSPSGIVFRAGGVRSRPGLVRPQRRLNAEVMLVAVAALPI